MYIYFASGFSSRVNKIFSRFSLFFKQQFPSKKNANFFLWGILVDNF